MARTKEFDPETVLDRAVDLFWERGYEGTSMADLVDRLGIARASLYATFGGKRELYLRALERYLERTDPVILAELSRPGPVLPALCALIDRFAAESAEEGGPSGCMVVNTAVELAPTDPAAARFVEASWSHLEGALASALARARAQGELASDADPRDTARFLLVLLQGMRVLGRAPGGGPRLRAAARRAHALFGAPDGPR